MAIQLGSAYGKVSLDVKGLLNAVKSGKAGLTEMAAVGQQVGQAMQNVGRSLTIGLTLPIAALGGASVKLASDFEETRNKAVVVFSDMADEVVSSSNKAARALGVSKTQYLDYASTVGAALTAGGMGIKEATELSEQAVQHFADLASFHNTQIEDAAEAWGSAIRGQFEPIQKYFPFITNQYLITYGTANGLIDENTKQLTANQRAVILNAIALDGQLNPALNDFAETSDGLANQQRIMKAQFEDMLVMLGENLLPIVLKITTALNDMLEKFNNMSPEMQDAVIAIAGFLLLLGPVINIIGKIVTLVSGLSGIGTFLGGFGISFSSIGAVITGTVIPAIVAFVATFGSIILAVGLVIVAIGLLYWAFKNNFGGIRTTAEQLWWIIKYGFKQMWQTINDGAKAGLEVLREGFKNAFEGLQARMSSFGDWLRNAWGNILEFFARVRDRIVDVFRVDWSQIGRFIIQGLITGLLGGNSALAGAVVKTARTILDTFRNSLGIHSESTVGKYFGRMTSQGYITGMAQGLDANRIAAMLQKPVSNVQNHSQQYVLNFASGLTVRDAEQVVEQRLGQMSQLLANGI